MHMAKVAISIDKKQLKTIDSYVRKKIFRNRSQAFQLSIGQMIDQIDHKRLALECEKLDMHFEQEMAEEEFDEDMTAENTVQVNNYKDI